MTGIADKALRAGGLRSPTRGGAARNIAEVIDALYDDVRRSCGPASAGWPSSSTMSFGP